MITSPDNSGFKNWLSIFVLGIIWGGAFLSSKIALGGIGLWWVAAGRVTLAAMALLYSIGSIITRRSPQMPPLAFSAAALPVGSVGLLPLAFWFEGPPPPLGNTAGYALIYAALAPTAIGAVMRVNIIRSAGSVFMSLTSYMVPVWAVIFGMLILGEQITSRMAIGMVLILLGIGLSQSRALIAMFKR